MLTPEAVDRGLTSAQQRESAYAAARRYLLSVPAEDIANLSTDGLRERLRKCLGLLAALVESSSPHEPLARTVDEAAAALAISPMAVYRLVNGGDLPAYRIWRRFIRIDEAALRSYLTAHAVGPGEVTGDDIPEEHTQPAWR